MNKQELATKIWATANELRKNIKASEYKDYILGFMFYKYLCDKEVDYLKDLGGEIDDLQDVDEDTKDKFKDGIGYFMDLPPQERQTMHFCCTVCITLRKTA